MLKIKNLIILLLILFLSITLATAIREINKHDLSTKKPTICNLKVKGPVYLITYGDGDAYIANERVLAESALNKCVDAVYMYRKEHIDPEFYAKNKAILDQPRGAGYWLWKPYVVMKTLEQIPENAVVIYLDSGFKVTKPLDRFINNLESADIVVVDYAPPHREGSKRKLLQFFDMDNESIRAQSQVAAGVFALRNTRTARDIISRWLEVGQIPGLIDDSSSEDEYSDFKRNFPEQAILSLIYLQNKSVFKLVPHSAISDVTWMHRRRNTNKTLYIEPGPDGKYSFWQKRLQLLLMWMNK